MMLDVATGERRELGSGASAVYSQDGYLVHEPADRRDAGLWALPFDLDTLTPTGESFRISDSGVGPSVSADGTLLAVDLQGERQRQFIITN